MKSLLAVGKLNHCCGPGTEMFPTIAAALNGNIGTSKV
jgi:hypothetical protein